MESEVVVITGASGGLGRAIARTFALRGAHIGLLARGADGLEATRQEVERLGGQAVIIQVDVADAEQVEMAADAIEEEFGPIDIWINNAMVTVFSPFKLMTPEDFRRVTDVAYHGYVYGTMAALKRMQPRNKGVIVQVGSALAYRGIPLQSAYCGAKHAIEGFCDSLRAELIHDGSDVRICMVQMPALNTPQFDWCKSNMPYEAQPVPPIFQPEVGAEAVLYAATHNRREVWVGAMNFLVMFLNKFIPAFGDWYLAKTGYNGQQTQTFRDPDSLDNLWHPVPGDHGAHGRFDDQSLKTDWYFRTMSNRGMLALISTAAAALVFTFTRRG